MAVVEIRKPFEVFNDANGNPLEGGFVYIGVSGSEAQSTPKAVYWDSALTIPASQPLRTRNGFVVNSNTGNPAPYYTDGAYSITVKDDQGITIASRLVNSDGAVTLGTMATQNTGTAGTEFRTNTENDARFLLQSAYSPPIASNATHFKIINGDFGVNQRGFSSGAIGVNTKLADRWEATALGGSCTAELVANTAVITNGVPKSFLRIVSSGQSAASDNCLFTQNIEYARTYSGQTVTIFFWARRATSGDIALQVTQSFGTGGSPSATVTAFVGRITISTTWQAYRVVISVPSVAGKTFGTANDDVLQLNFWTSAGATYNSLTASLGTQNTTVEVSGIHDRPGDVPIEAINFYQPPDPQAELARCQRYYVRLEDCMKISTASPTIGQTALPVTMRAVPTLNVTFGAGTGATFAASKTSVTQTGLHSQNATVTVLTASAEL